MLEAITLAPWFTAVLTAIASGWKILWDFMGRTLKQAFTFLAVWTPVIFSWVAKHYAARAAFFVVCIGLITAAWAGLSNLAGSMIDLVDPVDDRWWIGRWLWGPPFCLGDAWGFCVDYFGALVAAQSVRLLWSKFLWAYAFTIRK